MMPTRPLVSTRIFSYAMTGLLNRGTDRNERATRPPAPLAGARLEIQAAVAHLRDGTTGNWPPSNRAAARSTHRRPRPHRAIRYLRPRPRPLVRPAHRTRHCPRLATAVQASAV